MRLLFLTLLLFTVVGGPAAFAQAHTHTPYAGQQDRPIKALSPDEVEGYRSGAGMGLAKAAELNHYPGPRHVLDLADRLGLTADQRTRTQAVYDAMHAEAVRLGRQIVAEEAALDTLFAAGTADADRVRARTAEIGTLQGALRFVHLRAHLQMKEILTPEQVRRYDHLRGYGDAGHTGHHPNH